ncbi:MAG: exo-beta-N-acetylmuramidase NamZ family protein [Rhodanobacteraceae bacterium]
MIIERAHRCLAIVALLALLACSTSFAAAPAVAQKHSSTAFQTGIEALLHDRPDLIRGKRVGLITNPTGVDRELVSDVDLLAHTPGVHLVALFGPEHGIRGAHQAGASVGSDRDPVTGLPVYSLYGKTRQPTPTMLKGVDVLVFDVQAVGTRFYTYLYTMADSMKAAAAAHIPIIVLDRPDPIGGVAVQGPVLDPRFASFVGEYPIPLRYGMTIGELAAVFNGEFHIGADLTVVKMRGWKRSMYYDDTPLQFVMPSPNMPTETTALVYPGMGLVEGTNISEGRGTTRPFELAGAPWIDAEKLARVLNDKRLPGVRFRPVHFTPTFSKYEGKLCNGVQVHVMDRDTFDPVVVGLTVIETIHYLYPNQFAFNASDFDRLVGNGWVRQDIEKGMPVSEIQQRWQKGLSQFEKIRQKYLLYK